VAIENLKVHNHANDMLQFHYNENAGNSTTNTNQNGIQNVQKFVLPLNQSFSRVFSGNGK
jgi:hypothetical protein